VSATDLRVMIEIASTFAERAFEFEGGVAPIWHAVTARGEHHVIPALPTDKNSAAVLMRAFFELHDVVRCLFIDEAWTVEAKTQEERERVRAWVAEHGGIAGYPDRIEVVSMMCEDADAGQMTASRRIIRKRGHKPRLGPLVIHDMTGAQSEGRLVGMVPQRGRVH